MTYQYTQDLSTARYEIKIDPIALYGYFERNSDGSGGGLWFGKCDDQSIELLDYDGVLQLAQEVVQALRGAGYYLDETHDPDPPRKPVVSLERRRV